MVTNGTGSTLLVPTLRLPALPDAAAPPPAPQQDARVPLPAPRNDYDVSMDLTAGLAGIIDVSEEETRLRAQAWRFKQTFEARVEQHFGSRLVEDERNMAERTWQEVGANRAEVTSALEAVAANNAQLVAQGNIAFEQRDRALRQTVRVEFDGYRAHLAAEMQEDIPAHVEARIADVCEFQRAIQRGCRVERHAREHCEMFAVSLREEAHRELISVEGSSASRQARVQEELVQARDGEEYSVGRMHARRRLRSKRLQWPVVGPRRRWHSTTPVLVPKIIANDLRKASSLNAIALQSLNLFLRIWEPSCGKQAMVSELQDTALRMQAQVDEFVEQYAESTKRVIDRECSDVKKHEQDLVENAEALAWHEESVVTELRRELHQARLQVAQVWWSSSRDS